MKQRKVHTIVITFLFVWILGSSMVFAAGGKLNLKLEDTDLLPREVVIQIVNRDTSQRYRMKLTRMDGYQQEVSLPSGSYYTEEKLGDGYTLKAQSFDIGVDATERVKIDTGSSEGSGVKDTAVKMVRKNMVTILLIMGTAIGLGVVKKKQSI